MSRRELLIGCGTRREKIVALPGKFEWLGLTTLDISVDHKPDVVWDLNERPLPFDDNSFDEIHAYEVLEHIGRQGDWRAFFDEWSEWWRILKPNGMIAGTSPHWESRWAWGDPGHTRIISSEVFSYLSQPSYAQVGQTPMTDYRFAYKADFDLKYAAISDDTFYFALQAVKPPRANSK